MTMPDQTVGSEKALKGIEFRSFNAALAQSGLTKDSPTGGTSSTSNSSLINNPLILAILSSKTAHLVSCRNVSPYGLLPVYAATLSTGSWPG